MQIFGELGSQDSASENTAAGLEKFVCFLYGGKRLSSVNRVRKTIFWRSYSRDNKVIDLSLLPPCQTSLERHIRRATYLARIWRQASHPMMNIQDPQFYGWNEDLSTDWISVPYPEDISELLLANDEEMTASESESSDDDTDDDDTSDFK